MLITVAFSTLEISPSLAPPPLDKNLSVTERLHHLQLYLQEKHERSLVMYNFIQHYKTLLLACGISLEGSFEDPKVGRIKKFNLGETHKWKCRSTFWCFSNLDLNMNVHQRVLGNFFPVENVEQY